MGRDASFDLTDADKAAARASYIGNKHGLKTPDGQL